MPPLTGSASSPRASRAPRAVRAVHRCSECGWESAKWVGRCGGCQAWGSVAEVAPESGSGSGRVAARPVAVPAVPIGMVPTEESRSRTSGVPELDRVLGGGLVPGAAILLAGEPGVGKSTLLLEVAAQTARTAGLRGGGSGGSGAPQRTLYITGEESAAQVRLRADRTGGVHDELYLAAETDLGVVLGHVEQVRPTLLVIDSVQTVSASDVDGVPGGVAQVKEVAAALIRTAKQRNITTVLVGHVTKDGSIAGPRVLEHLVDVVLHFEGERSSRLRMVRAVKNRYGPVDEVGCFDLSAEGIVAITDPTGLFLDAHHGSVAGTCVSVAMEGRRPMPAEVQALVANASDRPRRTTSGVDSSRVAMILAVLDQHLGIRLGGHDIFVSTVGGARLTGSTSDTAVALAIASAHAQRALEPQTVAIGELGLSGELRRVPDLTQRIAEAARLGFRTAIVPAESPASAGRAHVVDGLRVVEVGHLRDAVDVAGLGPGAGAFRPRESAPDNMAQPAWRSPILSPGG